LIATGVVPRIVEIVHNNIVDKPCEVAQFGCWVLSIAV